MSLVIPGSNAFWTGIAAGVPGLLPGVARKTIVIECVRQCVVSCRCVCLPDLGDEVPKEPNATDALANIFSKMTRVRYSH